MVALCDHPLDPEMGLREPAAQEAQKALDTFDILGSVTGRSRIVLDELRPKIHLRASKSFRLNAFSQNWTTLLLFISSWVSSPARANVLSSASMNEAATITGVRPCERSGSWWALFLADVSSVDPSHPCALRGHQPTPHAQETVTHSWTASPRRFTLPETTHLN